MLSYEAFRVLKTVYKEQLDKGENLPSLEPVLLGKSRVG